MSMSNNNVNYYYYKRHRLDDDFHLDDESAYQLLLECFEHDDLHNFWHLLEEYPSALGVEKLKHINNENLLILLSSSKSKEALKFIEALLSWDGGICKWEIEGNSLLDIAVRLKNKELFKLLFSIQGESLLISLKKNDSGTRYVHVLENVLSLNDPDFTKYALEELKHFSQALQIKRGFENFCNLSKNLDPIAIIYFSSLEQSILDFINKVLGSDCKTDIDKRCNGNVLVSGIEQKHFVQGLPQVEELFINQVVETSSVLIKKQIELLKKSSVFSEPNLRSYILLLTSYESVFSKIFREIDNKDYNKKVLDLIEKKFSKYALDLSNEYLNEYLLKNSSAWKSQIFGMLKKQMIAPKKNKAEVVLEKKLTPSGSDLKEFENSIIHPNNGCEEIGPYGVLFFAKRLDLDCYLKLTPPTQNDNYLIYFLNTIAHYAGEDSSKELFTENFFYKRNAGKSLDVLFVAKVREHYELFKDNEYVKSHSLYSHFEQIIDSIRDGFCKKNESFFESIKLECLIDKKAVANEHKRLFAI